MNLPKNAFVNKFIAKTKFYEKASLSSKLQNEFINKIQKITWKYKLAEETIGISKTDKVTEIQIFEIELKEKTIPKNVLKVIDKAIPYQILYQFVYKDNTAYGITLKEKTTTHNYYFSEWNETLDFDFLGIDLEKVYHKLIKAFITNESKNRGDFDTIIDTDNKIKQLEKEIESLNNKIRKEHQFNRKVDLNKIFQEKKSLLNGIKGGLK
jgi:uncharacterized protein (UPF0248 family)